jgi:hypothetical protein
MNFETTSSSGPDRERELLIRCCASPASVAALSIVEIVERGVDWNRFMFLANRNSVTPMVAARLVGDLASDGGNIPAQIARTLKVGYEANLMRSRHQLDCVLEIAAAFERENIDALALKGPVLALDAYGDLAMRVFGDLDFLVRLEDLPRAAKSLERIGYASPAFDAAAVASGFFPDIALNFARADSIVDLHWRLAPRYFPFAPIGEQVWSNAVEIDVPMEFPEKRVRTLGPEDSILFQACHGSKHGWPTLAQICDFARVLERGRDLSPDALLDRASRIGSRRMLLLGVELAHALGLCAVRTPMLDAARRDRRVRTLAARVTRALFDVDLARRRDGALEEWAVAMRTIDPARGRLRYLIERVAAPKMSDRELIRLPRAWYPLYYLMRPVLVAIKHRDGIRSALTRTRPSDAPLPPSKSPPCKGISRMLTVKSQTRQNLPHGRNRSHRCSDKLRLWRPPGSVIVRVAFSDESGVGSKKDEPITVVTAVVLNMDRQWEPVSNGLYSIIGAAREKYAELLERKHALKGKLLYSAIRKKIPGADSILRATLELVIEEKLLVFYSAIDRTEFENYRGLLKITEHEKSLTPFDKAFEACFSVVDRTVRTVSNEQVLWIADRSDRDRESATKRSLGYHRLYEALIGAGGLIFGQAPMPLKMGGTSRIADTVYFGNSHESVALQLADVCCSTITLHLLEQDYGWTPVVGPYYEILRPAVLNHGMPVMFPPIKSAKNSGV